MTSSQKNMPGGMDESPHKGESNPLKPPKPSWSFEPIAENEPPTTDAWKANPPPGARTRAQAKTVETGGKKVPSSKDKSDDRQSLDRSEKDGDRQGGSKDPLLDQPARSGGDRSNDGLDQPDKSGGDRQNVNKNMGVTEDPEPDPRPEKTNEVEIPTPVVNTSDISTDQIENMLQTTEPSEGQAAENPETKGETPPEQETNAKEIEDSTKAMTPKKHREAAKPDREKTPRKFLKEKESKPTIEESDDENKSELGPPNWRKFEELDGVICIRKFSGTGDWSERDMRSLDRYNRRFENAIKIRTKDVTLEKASKQLRSTNLTKTTPKPESPEPAKTDSELEYTEEEPIKLYGITPFAEYDSDRANEEGADRRRRQRNDAHDNMISSLSAINSKSGQTTHNKDRLMSEISLDYHRETMHNFLAGTNGMKMLRNQRHQEMRESANSSTRVKRETEEIPRAPNQNREKTMEGPSKIPSDGGRESRNSRSRKKKPHNESDAEDEGSDNYKRPPRRPRSPGSPGGSGGDDPGNPRGPWGSGRHQSRRPQRDGNESDGWDRNVKMKHPTPYNGKPDIQVFDHWMASITNYAKTMKIREKTMIGMMSAYVTGKAGDFYMNRIAGKADEWTYEEVFQAIFDHCFPKHIIREFREQWAKLTQGKREVREYTNEIEKLVRKFPEMTERTVVLKLWYGLNPEIRALMIPMGADPERESLQLIIRMAELAESQLEQQAQIRNVPKENGNKRQPKREWTRFKNRNGGNVHFKPNDKEEKPAHNKTEKVRANAVSPQNANEQKVKNFKQRKLSRAKMDSLRAEGKCFNCHETGHEQRNCPKLNKMKPPQPFIRTGAINLAKMDHLAEQKEKAEIYCGRISVGSPDPIAEELKELEDIEFRVHQMCEKAWGEDPAWHNETTRPECKWSVGADELEITVWDFVNGGNRTFPRKAIDDPSFDIAKIFEQPDSDWTPKSVREGGYPLIEIYDRNKWPATNWLKARLTGQLEFVDERNVPPGTERIDIQPTMSGYSVQLDESDIIYNMTHKEVTDRSFSPEAVIDQLLTARKVPAERRGDKFVDKRFTKYVMLMLGMTSIPGQGNKIKKRGTKKRVIEPEGASAIERTSLKIKDRARKLPEPIIVQAKINGHTIRALLDSGSMADFLSTTVVDQLNLPKEIYQKPLSVHLAVHGSQSKINCGTTVNFQYQTINCNKRFDIANLDNYNAILGTPFLYQHQVAIGFNPSRVFVRSSEPQEMKGPEVKTISSAAAELLDKGLDEVCTQLRQEAEDLCPDTSKTALPPLRAVNHTIPLIDEKKIYRFRPSKCPEAFREQW